MSDRPTGRRTSPRLLLWLCASPLVFVVAAVAASGGFDWGFLRVHSYWRAALPAMLLVMGRDRLLALLLGSLALSDFLLPRASTLLMGGSSGWSCALLLLLAWVHGCSPLWVFPLARRTRRAVVFLLVLGSLGIAVDRWRFHAQLSALGGTTLEAASPPLATGAPRLLLVCLDGANWEVIDPLLARGELPHLAALIERGFRAPLQSVRSLRPTTRSFGWWSPVVWTSVATGLLPEHHGVLDFELADPRTSEAVPAGRDHWRSPPFWEVFGARGVRAAISGWWASWPARPFAGVLATLRCGMRGSPEAEDPYAEMRAFAADPSSARGFLEPPGLAARWLPRMELPTDGAALDAFVRRELLDLRTSRATTPSQRRVFRAIVAQDLLFEELARVALADGDFRLVSCYLEGTDTAQHHYWQYRGVPPEDLVGLGGDSARLPEVVDRAYGLADRWLGELIAAAGPEWNVLVISDHGHRSAPRRRMRSEHAGTGILIAAGPAFRSGRWPRAPWTETLGLERCTPSVLDVLPTLCALYRVAPATAFDGHALETLLRRPAAPPPPRPLEKGEGSPAAAVPVPAAAALPGWRPRLAALGYLDSK